MKMQKIEVHIKNTEKWIKLIQDTTTRMRMAVS